MWIWRLLGLAFAAVALGALAADLFNRTSGGEFRLSSLSQSWFAVGPSGLAAAQHFLRRNLPDEAIAWVVEPLFLVPTALLFAIPALFCLWRGFRRRKPKEGLSRIFYHRKR
ncbi:MAG: hypothetical protein AB7O88_17540 [Reyranellaceae bacterium]